MAKLVVSTVIALKNAVTYRTPIFCNVNFAISLMNFLSPLTGLSVIVIVRGSTVGGKNSKIYFGQL